MKYLSTAKLGAYQQKWAAQLADFDFEIKYRPGKIITNADVLSRLSSDNVDILSECIYGSAIPLEIKSAQSSVIFIESTDVSIAETFPSYTRAELREMQSKDAVITKCMEFIKSKILIYIVQHSIFLSILNSFKFIYFLLLFFLLENIQLALNGDQLYNWQKENTSQLCNYLKNTTGQYLYI